MPLLPLSYRPPAEVGEAGLEPASSALSEQRSNLLSYTPVFAVVHHGQPWCMWWILSLLAFGIAAFLAIAGIRGVSVEEIIGIISIGLFFLTLGNSEWTPSWTPRPRP